MRTTVTLDDDVAAAVERLRHEQQSTTSAAVNALARRGLAVGPPASPRFSQDTSDMGVSHIPIDDVAGSLEVLEGPAHLG